MRVECNKFIHLRSIEAHTISKSICILYECELFKQDLTKLLTIHIWILLVRNVCCKPSLWKGFHQRNYILASLENKGIAFSERSKFLFGNPALSKRYNFLLSLPQINSTYSIIINYSKKTLSIILQKFRAHKISRDPWFTGVETTWCVCTKYNVPIVHCWLCTMYCLSCVKCTISTLFKCDQV